MTALATRIAEALEAAHAENRLDLGDRDRLVSLLESAIGDPALIVELPAEPAWHDGVRIELVTKIVTANCPGDDAPAEAAREALLDDGRSWAQSRVKLWEAQAIDQALRAIVHHASSALDRLHEGQLPYSDGLRGFSGIDQALRDLTPYAAALPGLIDATRAAAYRQAHKAADS